MRCRADLSLARVAQHFVDSGLQLHFREQILKHVIRHVVQIQAVRVGARVGPSVVREHHPVIRAHRVSMARAKRFKQ